MNIKLIVIVLLIILILYLFFKMNNKNEHAGNMDDIPIGFSENDKDAFSKILANKTTSQAPIITYDNINTNNAIFTGDILANNAKFNGNINGVNALIENNITANSGNYVSDFVTNNINVNNNASFGGTLKNKKYKFNW